MLVAVSKALLPDAQANATERMHALVDNARQLSIRHELLDGKRAESLSGNRLIADAIHLPDVFLLNINQYIATLQRLAKTAGIVTMYGSHIHAVAQHSGHWPSV